MRADLSPQNYNSVHDYMDALFYGKDPSKEEVMTAKKYYWKSYNSSLIRKRRILKSEFTIALTKQELKMVALKINNEKSITEYVRKVFLAHLNSNTSHLAVDTSVIEQRLFLIVGFLEDILDTESVVDSSTISQIESKIKHLESLLETYFDNQE